MLQVDRLNVSYGKIQVLWDVSINVNEGEIVAIVGSNGAGKTTLLKTISGLIRPISGDVIFKGEKITNLHPNEITKKRIVLVPEGRCIFPKLTVSENLNLCAHGYSKSEKKEILHWIFELFPILQERKNQLAMVMSGGEQQMLSIAQALLLKPSLLMLDDLSLGLSPVFTQKIFDAVKDINIKGLTILIVEQNVYDVLNLANRGYVLENGRIVLEDTGKNLLKNEKVKEAYLGL
jgi:branched-chain amino acid transport system ATP-binding protein